MSISSYNFYNSSWKLIIVSFFVFISSYNFYNSSWKESFVSFLVWSSSLLVLIFQFHFKKCFVFNQVNFEISEHKLLQLSIDNYDYSLHLIDKHSYIFCILFSFLGRWKYVFCNLFVKLLNDIARAHILKSEINILQGVLLQIIFEMFFHINH